MGRLHGDDSKRGQLSALGHRGKEWKARFFVIKDNFLHYFKKVGASFATNASAFPAIHEPLMKPICGFASQDGKPDGVIPLEGCTISPSPQGKKVDRVRSASLHAPSPAPAIVAPPQ